MYVSTPIGIRFWSKVDDSGDCWEWTGDEKVHGYGRISANGREKVLAHRLSFFLETGVNPGELCVCHHCDNPGCVNPSHLFLGTKKDNHDDMKGKGRGPDQDGPKNGNAKLTADQVRYIRAAHTKGIKGVDLAAAFGVGKNQISRIRKRKAFKNVV